MKIINRSSSLSSKKRVLISPDPVFDFFAGDNDAGFAFQQKKHGKPDFTVCRTFRMKSFCLYTFLFCFYFFDPGKITVYFFSFHDLVSLYLINVYFSFLYSHAFVLFAI